MTQPYDIEEVRRKYIGFETAVARGRYPVEHDSGRRDDAGDSDGDPAAQTVAAAGSRKVVLTVSR